MAEATMLEPGSAFAHHACIYASGQEFLAMAIPFVRNGLALDEPVLVATTAANLQLLGDALRRCGQVRLCRDGLLRPPAAPAGGGVPPVLAASRQRQPPARAGAGRTSLGRALGPTGHRVAEDGVRPQRRVVGDQHLDD